MVPNTTPFPRLLTVDEVAELLRICTKTVRRMIHAGEIKAVRAGRQWRVSERDVKAYLARAG